MKTQIFLYLMMSLICNPNTREIMEIMNIRLIFPLLIF